MVGSKIFHKFAPSYYAIIQDIVNKRRYVLCLYVKSVGNLSQCARDGNTILGVMWHDSACNILGSTHENYTDSRSNRNSPQNRNSCRSCNGTGIDPSPSYENCDHYPGRASFFGFYNSAGSR